MNPASFSSEIVAGASVKPLDPMIGIFGFIALIAAIVEGLTFHEGPLLGAEAGVGKLEAGYWAGLPGKLFAKINEDEHGRGPTQGSSSSGW